MSYKFIITTLVIGFILVGVEAVFQFSPQKISVLAVIFGLGAARISYVLDHSHEKN